MPPILTELIDVGELARLHGVAPDSMPWSVEHSIKQWRQDWELLMLHLNYVKRPNLPSCCKEKDRQIVSSFQAAHRKRPKQGNPHSLVDRLKDEGKLRQF